MSTPKTTKCPSPAYAEYKPDHATRSAQEKAARVQPPLFALASKLPSYRKGE